MKHDPFRSRTGDVLTTLWLKPTSLSWDASKLMTSINQD